MGWFSRRKEDREARLVETLASALGQALGRVFDAQAHQIEQSSRFLDSLQDLSARKAAQIMGSRGGRTTQARKRNAAKAPARPSCRLCANPMSRGVTLEEIQIHRSHGNGVEEVETVMEGPAGPPALPNGEAN